MNDRAVFTEHVRGTASILRDIITIIMALAFTAALVGFLTSDGVKPVVPGAITK